MQFLKSAPIADTSEDPEERLQRWRNSYQAYQNRLAAFYSEQNQLGEQVRRRQEYQRELGLQQEDLARYKRELIQKQILHGKGPVSF